jgi:hypothetical protein
MVAAQQFTGGDSEEKLWFTGSWFEESTEVEHYPQQLVDF